jgi:hypothetical protein
MYSVFSSLINFYNCFLLCSFSGKITN